MQNDGSRRSAGAEQSGEQIIEQPGRTDVSLLKKFKSNTMLMKMKMPVISLVVILAGLGTGYMLSGTSFGKDKASTKAPINEISKTEAGITDESTFRDTAEGVLVEGGLDGEGTHHLEREGGEEKYVYLVSTAINMDNFVGKKVQIWGETMAAINAPWLMDVGKIKVIE